MSCKCPVRFTHNRWENSASHELSFSSPKWPLTSLCAGGCGAEGPGKGWGSSRRPGQSETRHQRLWRPESNRPLLPGQGFLWEPVSISSLGHTRTVRHKTHVCNSHGTAMQGSEHSHDQHGRRRRLPHQLFWWFYHPRPWFPSPWWCCIRKPSWGSFEWYRI